MYTTRTFPLALLLYHGAALVTRKNVASLAEPLPELRLPYGTWQANSYDQDADVPSRFSTLKQRITDWN
jgi:hypothetical protein